MQQYHSPSDLDEVLQLLKHYQGRARIIAGGTDLFLQMRNGQKQVQILVDISGIPELKRIEQDDGRIIVGAAVTHAMLERSVIIKKRATALAEAAGRIGSPQIRNMGTIGGNIVNAAPAADTAVALTALNALAEVVDVTGNRRSVPVTELYAGINQSIVDSTCEMVVAFYLSAHESGHGSAFYRFSQREALALPVANCAVRVIIKNQCLTDVCIAVAPSGPAPCRLNEVEAFLKGQNIRPEIIIKAKQLAVMEAKVRSSPLRGSEYYRRELIGEIVKRALNKAIERASGTSSPIGREEY